MRQIAFTLFVCLAVPVAGFAQPWPSFRGPDASGVATGARPPVTWNLDDGTNVAWRTAIPGLGHSSPIVWGDRVYVTTAVPLVETSQELRLGEVGSAGIDSATDIVRHSWRLYALDRRTGRVVWERVAHEGVPRIKRHVKASHASATPATDGRHIVALFGSEGLYAFDMDGRVLWSADLGAMDVGLVDDPTYQWGPASSPVIHGDLVIVQNDRHRDSFLAAYDLRTGRQVWRAARDEMPSWATPAIYRNGDRAVVVTNSPRFVRGYDAATGEELWRLPDEDTQVKVPTPVVAGDLVIVTGGYPSRGRPIYAIRPDARGTLGLTPDGDGLAWRADRGSPYTPTPLVLDGLVYAVTDNGILSAYDQRSGNRVYQQRLGGGGGFSASPVAADGHLYLASEDGDVYVVRAGRDFELVATNAMKEPCLATPAPAGDLLVVRTRTHVVALGRGSS